MNQALANAPASGRAARSPDPFDQAQFEQDFGRYLVEAGIIDRMVLERAASASRKTGDRLDRVLTKLGLLPETGLAAALSRFLGVELVQPASVPTERVLADRVEAEFVRRHRLLPLSTGEGVVVLGVVDPFHRDPMEALAYLTRLAVEIRIFAPADFDKAFEALYAVAPKESGGSVAAGGEASELDVQRLRDIASEAPVIRLVNQIVASAVEARASDIHIEPQADQVLVRYRIDGLLRTAQALLPDLRAAVTSRIKIMSKLDIAERRLPQDGRIKLAVRGVDIDFRVSTIPTSFGERVVMRILDRTRVELDFTRLGFGADHIAALLRLVQQPNGIILVTGPTGSGKTTTLYTALKSLNRTDSNIFSVEDPIEYQLAGINQVQVQAEIGLDFPQALRSILRQDPDIIMIGEIRDLETARIAIQSSLTGHLVLSTLHTNSAAAAITRLIDIGVENYLLASTVRGVVAQRLVRKLCPHCAGRHEQADYWAAELARTVPAVVNHGPPSIRSARGCAECAGLGFSGRSTIAEILLVDEPLQRLILQNVSDAEIDAAARESGMVNMYEIGAAKVWRGETTIDEVLRATRMG